MITWLGIIFGVVGAVWFAAKGEYVTAMWAATSAVWAINCKTEERRHA